MAVIRRQKERDLFSIKSGRRKVIEKTKQKSRGTKKKFKASTKISEKATQFEALTYDTIPEGQNILGCIREIHQYEMIFSLPNRMQGVLPITSISRSYIALLSKVAEGEEVGETVYSLDDLYTVGDMLITNVKSVTKSQLGITKITLSILPEDVNAELRPPLLMGGVIVQSAVVSVEENGYIMDAGIKGLRAAFLPSIYAPGGVGVGSVVMCCVKEILSAGDEAEEMRIKLSGKAKNLLKSVRLPKRSNVAAVCPGTLVIATVEKVFPFGIKLSLGSNLGVVNLDHLINPDDSVNLYEVGQEVEATVLYVTRLTSIIHCSLNKRICQKSLHETATSFNVGDIVEKAKVYKTSKQGVHLLLPNSCHGFCSVNRLQDKPISPEQVEKSFPVGRRTTCRIINSSLMDQMFIVSLSKALLEQQFVGRKDIEIGSILKCKVLEHQETGIMVSLSEHLKGFIPKPHLTESVMRPELKYPVGQMVTARVLKVNPGRDPHLTMKTDLLKMKLPVVTKFDDSNVGVETLGRIVYFPKGGLLVEFFGGTSAFVPGSKIPQWSEKKESFKEGNFVKCVILSVDSSNSKMIAAIKVGKERGVVKKLQVKAIVSGRISLIKEEKIFVTLKGLDGTAFIPMYHLSDDIEISRSLFSVVNAGDLIREAVVFSKDKSGGGVVLSLKPSVYQSVLKEDDGEKVLKALDNFPCVVTKVQDQNIEVSTYKGIFGNSYNIGKKNLFKRCKYAIPLTGVHAGQTLFAKCIAAKEEKRFLSCSLRDVMVDKQLSSFQYLYNELIIEEYLLNKLKKMGEPFSSFGKVKVGDIYNGKVVHFTKTGVLLHIPSLSLDGIICSENVETKPSLGKTLEVRVLRINFKEKCLELSTRSFIKRLCNTQNHEVKVGEVTTCEVVLTKREFIMGRLKAHKGHVVYLPAKRHINDMHGRHYCYEIGNTYKVRIKFIEGKLILADFFRHDSKNTQLQIVVEIPKIILKSKRPHHTSEPLTLSKENLTDFDFRQKAEEKIKKVTQFLLIKKSMIKEKALINSETRKTMLERDKFKQFDENYYWDFTLKLRKERNKQQKLKGITKKVPKPKRKLQEANVDNKARNVYRKTKKIKLETDENGTNQEIEEGVVEEVMENSAEDKRKELEENKCLHVKLRGFDWGGQTISAPVDEAYSSDDEDDKDRQQRSLKRMNKFEIKSKAKTHESRTRELELQRLDPDRQPETAMDFEEKIEKSPTSSSVWIEYASFYLENAEMEKARVVISRALSSIPATLEGERLALWNVMLRLELMYGTPDSVQNSLREAVVTNDELKVLYIMIDIYVSANKMKEAEDVVKMMTKKFSQTKEVWIRAGLFYFKSKALKEARDVLERSLLSLPREEHLEIINRFAQFELKYGEAERGRTIFEKILSNFPKRLDIWNVYADLLIKDNNIQEARNVLERMCGLKLRLKAMRSVFKKLLEFEKQHGTARAVEAVKAKVEEYVAAALNEND